MKGERLQCWCHVITVTPLFFMNLTHSVPSSFSSLALDEVLNYWDLAYGIEGEEKVWTKRLAKFQGEMLSPTSLCYEGATRRLPWDRHLRIMRDPRLCRHRSAFNLMRGRALLQMVFNCRHPSIYPISRYQEVPRGTTLPSMPSSLSMNCPPPTLVRLS